MKKVRVLVLALTLVLVSTASVFAASFQRPADIIEEVTGLTWEEVRNERIVNGKTAGEIAESKGKLSEYKTQLINYYTERINADVENGRLTQEEANLKISEIKSFIEGASASQLDNGMALGGRNCGGMMGSKRNFGKSTGVNSGRGLSNGSGFGLKDGSNQGRGLANGSGMGLKDGTGPMCNR